MKFFIQPAIPSRQWEALLNEFADLLSFEMPLNQISETMGITRGTVCVFLHELCDRYGERV